MKKNHTPEQDNYQLPADPFSRSNTFEEYHYEPRAAVISASVPAFPSSSQFQTPETGDQDKFKSFLSMLRQGKWNTVDQFDY